MQGGYRATIMILAAIAATGSVAIHMLVPALPLIAADLAIGEAKAQQVVSVYLAGLGSGQLVAGPLIDRVGRRPVMIAGLVLFMAGALAGALATSTGLLLAARAVQAVGGACGVVTARVMVGDLFGKERAKGAQATLMTIVLISPAIAPVIGGSVADLAGWRAIFALLALAGAATLLAASLRLPETAAVTALNQRTGLFASYARLARNHQFLLTAATLGAASSGLYMFLGAAPFLLVHRFGLSSGEAGLALLWVAAASIAGTRLVVPIERHFSALIVGTASSALGASTALVLALGGVEGVMPLIAPILLLGLGAGLAGPVAFNAIGFAEPGLAATATSLAGALQMLASGSAMSVLGLFAPIDPLRLAVALVITTSTALFCALARSRLASAGG